MPAFQDGIAETEIPVGDMVQTDVLIVGSGPAGGSAALFLAELGIPALLVSKYVSRDMGGEGGDVPTRWAPRREL